MNAYRIVKAIERDDNIEVVQEILEKPKLINGINTLPTLVYFGSHTFVELFGDIEAYPLEDACFRDNFEMVKLLVENGANVNIRCFENSTPLIVALQDECHHSRFQIANYLIDNGADISAQNSLNEVPLTLCLKRSEFPEDNTDEKKHEQLQLFIYLLEHCNSIDVPEHIVEYAWWESYSTLLEATIVYNNPEAMHYLLDNGYFSDEDIPMLNGSRMSFLAYKSCLEIFDYYYHKEDINNTDEAGKTMLHNAVLGGQKEICEFLLEEGADTTIKDNDGKTARDYIDMNDEMEVENLVPLFDKYRICRQVCNNP